MGSGWKVDTLFKPPQILSANELRALEYDELDIVLMELVKYLRHSNPIVSGVAFNEVITSPTILSSILIRVRS